MVKGPDDFFWGALWWYFCGPLYLAVTCSFRFLPEEYSRIRRIQRFPGSTGGYVIVSLRWLLYEFPFSTWVFSYPAIVSRPALCVLESTFGLFGTVSVYSAMLGSTVDTCYASVLGWLLEQFHDLLKIRVHSAPEVDSRASSLAVKIPQVQFLVLFLTCPLLCMSRSSTSLSWRSGCFPWSCSENHRDSPVAVHRQGDRCLLVQSARRQS